MEAGQVTATGWAELVEGSACYTEEHTCDAGAKRAIDWFVVNSKILGHVTKVQVQIDAPTRPHWP
eukprot:6473311-Amphidinium_carterae.1